jgi:hypothetical protein
MESFSRTQAADHVILASARLAGHIGRGEAPPPKDLFLLLAALVEGAKQEDRRTIELALDGVAGLLDGVPQERTWDWCRGHLKATMDFAWLLLRDDRSGDVDSD